MDLGDLELEDVLGTETEDFSAISDKKYTIDFLKDWHQVTEPDPFKWVLNKTRLNEKQIPAIAFYIYARKQVIDNDIRIIFRKDPEEFKRIHFPLYDGAIAYMHGQISLHGKEREELTKTLMPPDLRKTTEEEPQEKTLRQRFMGQLK